MVVRKSLYLNSKGDNLRLSQIQTSLVMSDYKILQILRVFRDPPLRRRVSFTYAHAH